MDLCVYALTFYVDVFLLSLRAVLSEILYFLVSSTRPSSQFFTPCLLQSVFFYLYSSLSIKDLNHGT